MPSAAGEPGTPLGIGPSPPVIDPVPAPVDDDAVSPPPISKRPLPVPAD